MGGSDLGFLGLNTPLVTPMDRGHGSCGSRRSDRRAITAPNMSYAKKNKKKKKLMKKGLIRKPEDTRLLDLPVPETLEGSIAIVWFRKDLRLRDNEALALANTADYVILLYVFDEREFGPDNLSSFGFEKTGPFQAAFLVESVKNLRRNCRIRGVELLIRTGKPEKIITDMCREYLSNGMDVNVLAQKEVTKEETTVEFLLQRSLKRISTEEARSKLHLLWGSTMHHIQDLPYTAANFFPISFTTFKQRVDRKKKKGIVRPEIETPDFIKNPPEPELEPGDVPSLSQDLRVDGLMEPLELEKPFPMPQACYAFKGGEDQALARIDDFIWKKDALYQYAELKNSMGTSDFSTKLSPYLALGCVSARTVWWEAMRYQEKHPRKVQQGTFNLEVNLQWRDFFRLTAVVYKNQLFARDGLGQRDKRGRLTSRTFAKREPTEEQWERIKKWMDGKTGVPFIDAPMRELKYSGYMSNRCRQNCASYLVNDLGCPDWRIGAEYFQSKLIDHDVTSNWMGWQYVSGVSNDPKHGRRYPVLKQALTYDPYGIFVRRWLPELALCPAPEIHAPFLFGEEEQDAYEVKVGATYPAPVTTPWKIPEEIDRPTELPAEEEVEARERKPKLQEEVEALVGDIDGAEDLEEDESERFFTANSEEHVDSEGDFLAELMALEEDGTEDMEDDDEELEEVEGLGDLEASAEEAEYEGDEEADGDLEEDDDYVDFDELEDDLPEDDEEDQSGKAAAADEESGEVVAETGAKDVSKFW